MADRGVIFLLAAAGTFAVTSPFPRPEPPAGQPIAFAHATHVTAGLVCQDCHTGALSGESATIPRVEKCLECHDSAVGESPDEPLIRQFAESGLDIPWRPRTRIGRSHVQFSHRRHTDVAAIACEDCHGDMGALRAPPTETTSPISMTWCLDCHRELNVGDDCLACHR